MGGEFPICDLMRNIEQCWICGHPEGLHHEGLAYGLEIEPDFPQRTYDDDVCWERTPGGEECRCRRFVR